MATKTMKEEYKGLEKDLEEYFEVVEGKRKALSDRFEKWTYIVPPTGDDVRRIRAKLKMSQKQFAQFLFVSTVAVQAWEQGTRRPDSTAAVLLRLLAEDKKGEIVRRVLALHG